MCLTNTQMGISECLRRWRRGQTCTYRPPAMNWKNFWVEQEGNFLTRPGEIYFMLWNTGTTAGITSCSPEGCLNKQMLRCCVVTGVPVTRMRMYRYHSHPALDEFWMINFCESCETSNIHPQLMHGKRCRINQCEPLIQASDLYPLNVTLFIFSFLSLLRTLSGEAGEFFTGLWISECNIWCHADLKRTLLLTRANSQKSSTSATTNWQRKQERSISGAIATNSCPDVCNRQLTGQRVV